MTFNIDINGFKTYTIDLLPTPEDNINKVNEIADIFYKYHIIEKPQIITQDSTFIIRPYECEHHLPCVNVKEAVERHHLNCLKIITKITGKLNYSSTAYAFKTGNVEILEWLSRKNRANFTIYSLTFAIKHSNFDCLIWAYKNPIVNNIKLINENTLSAAIAIDNIEITKAILGYGIKWKDKYICGAANTNSISIIKWCLVERDNHSPVISSLTDEHIKHAIYGGSIEILEIFLQNKIKLTGSCYILNRRESEEFYLNVFNLLYKHNCPKNELVVNEALKYGFLKIANWLVERDFPCEKGLFTACHFNLPLDENIILKDKDFSNFAYFASFDYIKTFYKYKPNFLWDALDWDKAIFEANREDVIEWLISKCDNIRKYEKYLCHVISNKNFKLFYRMIEAGCVFRDKILLSGDANNILDVYKFLKENKYVLEPQYFMFTNAIILKDKEMLKYMDKNETIDFWKDVDHGTVELAKATGDLEILEIVTKHL